MLISTASCNRIYSSQTGQVSKKLDDHNKINSACGRCFSSNKVAPSYTPNGWFYRRWSAGEIRQRGEEVLLLCRADRGDERGDDLQVLPFRPSFDVAQDKSRLDLLGLKCHWYNPRAAALPALRSTAGDVAGHEAYYGHDYNKLDATYCYELYSGYNKYEWRVTIRFNCERRTWPNRGCAIACKYKWS